MRILVVDDHPPICEVLSLYLERIGPQFSGAPITVTSVGTLSEAQVLVSSEDRPDLVFLDLTLEDDNRGAITFERFQSRNPHKIPVVIYTGMSLADAGATETLLHCYNTLGARSILLKSAKAETMLMGLPRLLVGESWMPDDIFKALLNAKSLRPQAPNLTPAETRVKECLVRGLPDKLIADELKLSRHYVRQVLGGIYKKLGVHTRLEAVLRLSELSDKLA